MFVRRLVGAAAGIAAGVAVWLTAGTEDVGNPTRLGAAGVLQVETRPEPDRRGLPEKPREQPPEGRAGASAAISLEVTDELDIDFDKRPAAGLVFDVGSGRTLWRRNPTDQLPVASLTKIMSALIVSEELERPGRLIPIGSDAAGLDAAGGLAGSAVGLEPGMRVKAGALFQSMMVASANDAATALAIHVAGTADRFVKRMNRRARRLGLDCTRFVSPHGLEPENRSCAADLAALTRVAMDQARIARIAGKERAIVDFPIDGGRRHLATTNPLLQEGYGGTVGLKTGYTQEAGSCLVAVARRDGRTLGAVLVDSPDVADQAKRLLDAAFEAEADRRSERGGARAARQDATR